MSAIMGGGGGGGEEDSKNSLTATVAHSIARGSMIPRMRTGSSLLPPTVGSGPFLYVLTVSKGALNTTPYRLKQSQMPSHVLTSDSITLLLPLRE